MSLQDGPARTPLRRYDTTTEIGGTNGNFPQTSWTLIREVADAESPLYRESLNELAMQYWRPVYMYFRIRWRRTNEDAKDLAQEFFAALSRKECLGNLTPNRGRFRSYLMAALANFVRQRHRFDTRLRRGGGARHASLSEEADLAGGAGETAERLFRREWARTILSAALAEMEQEYRSKGMETQFRLFRLHEVDAPPDADLGYEALARRFDTGVNEIRNYLYRARENLRKRVFQKVSETVSGEQEAEEEMRQLFEDLAR